MQSRCFSNISYQRRRRCCGFSFFKLKLADEYIAFLFGTFQTNTKTIIAESCHQTKLSTYNFIWKLGKSLLVPDVQRRYNDSNGIRKSGVMKKMKKVLEISDPKRSLVAVESSICCYNVWLGYIVGTLSYLDVQEKLNQWLK